MSDRPTRIAAQRSTVIGLIVLGVALAGACAPDLGPCDAQAARSVVLARDGRPAFEGQALMTVSCANGGVCHSPDARDRLRFGVPADLDFQVSVACAGTASCGAAGERLRRDQRRTVDFAYHIATQIDRGDMPPPRVGREIVSDEAKRRDYHRLDGTAMPGLDTAEGRHSLRNWLACGAPVVENLRLALEDGETKGAYCGPGPDGIGDCIYGEYVPLSPTFSDLYDRFFAPVCANCHGPGPLDSRRESGLDLSTRDLAYMALVGAEPKGRDCAGSGGSWVVPNDVSASRLLDKMTLPTSDPKQCGDAMPPGERVGDDVLSVIRAWIEAGATAD